MARDDAGARIRSTPGRCIGGADSTESDILARGTAPANNGKITPDGARKFLSVFQNYVAGKETPVDTEPSGGDGLDVFYQ